MNSPKTAQTRSAAPKLLSRRTLVIITRDQTAHTPRAVWSHELPILEALFGEGNVKPAEVELLDEGYSKKISPDLLVHNKQQDRVLPPSETLGLDFVFIGDTCSEFERLMSAYGKHPEKDELLVEYVYGRFQEGKFERVIGSPELDDLPDEQLRTLIRSYGYLPIINFQMPGDAKAEALEVIRKFNALAHDELVALAREVGIEFA